MRRRRRSRTRRCCAPGAESQQERTRCGTCPGGPSAPAWQRLWWPAPCGTTAPAVAHVGDSRCYLFRKGQAALLTRDHTVAQEHVRLGLLSASEAADAATRHVLSRSLGSELIVAVEISEHQIFVGDVLLLCSDGLHGAVTASEMAAVAGHGGDLKAAAQRLVDIANQRDGSDNISLQIIRVRSVERVGMYRGRPLPASL